LKDGAIPTADVRRCLIALNAPPKDKAELRELVETVDPDETGWVDFERFVAIAALKLHARHDDPEAQSEEVQKAYKLFTKGQEREISINDLRRVAKELREDVPENVLKDMIREATGGGLGGVSMEDFEGVMGRAGVFSR
jgi:Ca2+-binding EF-hand superfamily protein